MQTDHYTIALLVMRADAPTLDKDAQDALQDAHMAHLSMLHEQGDLLVAGPVLGGPEGRVRGVGIYRGDVEHTRTLTASDPAVRADRYHSEVHPWMVPAGMMTFAPGRLPASMAEATR